MSLKTTPIVWAEDEDRSAVETGIVAIADSLEGITTSGDTITIPRDMPYIAMAYVTTEDDAYPMEWVRLTGKNIGGPGLDTWRLERQFIGGEASGIVGGAVNLTGLYDFRRYPRPSMPGGLADEVITCYGWGDDEAGETHLLSCVLVLTNRPLPVVRPSDVRIDYIVTCTLAGTGAGSVWKADAPAFDDNIPAGNYRIMGGEVCSATLIASRLRVTGQHGYRAPAIIPKQNEQDAIHPHNYMIYPGGIPWSYGGNQINNLFFEYMALASETPTYGKLFLQKA